VEKATAAQLREVVKMSTAEETRDKESRLLGIEFQSQMFNWWLMIWWFDRVDEVTRNSEGKYYSTSHSTSASTAQPKNRDYAKNNQNTPKISLFFTI
jgi:hypothetical protein